MNKIQRKKRNREYYLKNKEKFLKKRKTINNTECEKCGKSIDYMKRKLCNTCHKDKIRLYMKKYHAKHKKQLKRSCKKKNSFVKFRLDNGMLIDTPFESINKNNILEFNIWKQKQNGKTKNNEAVD